MYPLVLCGSAPGQVVYDQSEIRYRDYEVNGSDLEWLEDSHWYPSTAVISCEGDTLLHTGLDPYDGMWTRLGDARRDAVADLLSLRCGPYFGGCYGNLYGDQPCGTDADCPYTTCVDASACDLPGI